jgi:hypothetical protein
LAGEERREWTLVRGLRIYLMLGGVFAVAMGSLGFLGSSAGEASTPGYDLNVTHGDGGGEPAIAYDPYNPNRLVAVDMQTPATTTVAENPTTAATCSLWYSDNGGRTWTGGRRLPTYDDPPHGSINTSCEDPSMAWGPGGGPDGTLYIGAHHYASLNLAVNHWVIISSTDGGRTFTPATTLSANDRVDASANDQPQYDRPFRGWTFVDTTTGTAYVETPPIGVETDGTKGPPQMTSPELFISDDHGRTWKGPRTSGSDATAANGVVATLLSSNSVFATSNDEGQTWKTTNQHPTPSAISASSATGNLWVRADPSHPGRYAIEQETTSTINVWVTQNSGVSWSGPVKLAESTSSNDQRSFSWMNYGPTGVLGVTWRTSYKNLNPYNPVPGHGVYDVWVAISTDGGQVFAPPVRVSSALSYPPSVTSQYWGAWSSPGGDDFQDLVTGPANTYLVWGDWRTSPTDTSAVTRSMYFARVPIASGH